jgi:hypothetical protein
MKNALFTLALVFAVVIAANGQASMEEIQEQATEKTRTMMQLYQLNESDYLRLKALNVDYLTQHAELQQRFRNDRPLLAAKVKAARNAFEQNLIEVISPEHYARIQQKNAVIAQASRK